MVPVPARSSRGVGVTVKVAKKVKPGLYRGTVFGRRPPGVVAAGGVDRPPGVMTSIADRSDLTDAVETKLREVGRAVRRAMLDAMPDGEPVQWLYGPMREYPSRVGKALRPALCLSAGRAFGATGA